MAKFTPPCPHCQTRMNPSKISTGNLSGLALGLFLLVFGVAVTILIPIIGWVLGPLIALFGLTRGGKVRKIWRCPKCGVAMDRI